LNLQFVSVVSDVLLLYLGSCPQFFIACVSTDDEEYYDLRDTKTCPTDSASQST